jgi:quercetin dioxygenase-like cupin family protein
MLAGDNMHYFGKFQEGSLLAHPVFSGHSQGYTHAPLIDHTTGSVHTGLSINELGPGGNIAPHVHSFEEGFYLLSGEAVVSINDQAYRLRAGDFGVAKVGALHAWRQAGPVPVRWCQMAAPQPKPVGKERDTFFQKGGVAPGDASLLDLNDLKGNLLGHFDASMIPPVAQRTNVAPGLEGVFLKWMIDEHFGARHHRMLFIEYQPGVSIALHDHTFEEAYFILTGEVQGTMDGQTYLARPGDVLWTSVGCVHTFVNVGKEPVRWLETFAPIPPAENVFRFMRDWDKRQKELEG